MVLRPRVGPRNETKGGLMLCTSIKTWCRTLILYCIVGLGWCSAILHALVHRAWEVNVGRALGLNSAFVTDLLVIIHNRVYETLKQDCCWSNIQAFYVKVSLATALLDSEPGIWDVKVWNPPPAPAKDKEGYQQDFMKRGAIEVAWFC